MFGIVLDSIYSRVIRPVLNMMGRL